MSVRTPARTTRALSRRSSSSPISTTTASSISTSSSGWQAARARARAHAAELGQRADGDADAGAVREGDAEEVEGQPDSDGRFMDTVTLGLAILPLAVVADLAVREGGLAEAVLLPSFHWPRTSLSAEV